jgi:hypothetical protein
LVKGSRKTAVSWWPGKYGLLDENINAVRRTGCLRPIIGVYVLGVEDGDLSVGERIEEYRLNVFNEEIHLLGRIIT